MTEHMVLGRLYVCRQEIRLNGSLPDGSAAFARVPVGSPVIPVRSDLGEEAVLVDGAVVPFPWSSPAWSYLFSEASDAQE